jgi:uncharacterized membrane protein
MSKIEKSVEVGVPVRTAYDQWTQFEEFPRFMEGVEHVRQLDDRRLSWKAKVAGKTVEWTAEIHEQVPDRRIAWRSTSGARNEGVVTFASLGPSRTRVTLSMEVDPASFGEKVGDSLGLVEKRVEGDLERFKKFIEARGRETGAWRGEIHGDEVRKPSAPGAHA